MQILDELLKRRVLTSALIYVPFAWVTTEVLTFLFDKFSAPIWAEDLTAAAFVAGFPTVMVLAWTFDVGPAGITRATGGRREAYVAVLLATLIMGVGTTGLFRQINSNPKALAPGSLVSSAPKQAANSAAAAKSVAVYTFENLSSDPENAYFSEGISSELIARLSKINGLKIAVLARTKQEVVTLGLEPDVSYRLEGSVRKAGSAVRIAAQLTDLATGFTVWAEEFDGNLDDVFALQEQTALRIVEALDMQLSTRESAALAVRDTENHEAYDTFLRGWSLIESLHVSLDGAESKLTIARDHFQQALAIDPGYTRAIAGLSMVESYAVFLELVPKSQLNLARRLAEEAITRDDSLYESHFAMAKVLATEEDNRSSIAEYRKVIELDPQNGYAWCELSYVLNAQDPLGAETAAREAIRYRPAYSLAYINLGAALQKQDRLSEAVDAYRQSLQLDPGNPGLQRVIGRLDGELALQRPE